MKNINILYLTMLYIKDRCLQHNAARWEKKAVETVRNRVKKIPTPVTVAVTALHTTLR